MLTTIQMAVCIIGVLLSLYLLMSKTIDTKSCFDTLLISCIGIHWAVAVVSINNTIVSSLVLQIIMLCLYITIICFRYKGKENNICTILGER